MAKIIGKSVKVQFQLDGEWVDITNQATDISLDYTNPNITETDNEYLLKIPEDVEITIDFNPDPLEWYKAMYWLSGGRTPCMN